MQRQHQRAAVLQRGLGAAYFRHAREKRQDIAVMCGQRGADSSGDGFGQFARVGDVAW